MGTLQPLAGHSQLLFKPTVHKGLLRGGQAQCQHVPADHLGRGREFGAQFVARLAAAVGDGLHGQPFQPRAFGQVQVH